MQRIARTKLMQGQQRTCAASCGSSERQASTAPVRVRQQLCAEPAATATIVGRLTSDWPRWKRSSPPAPRPVSRVPAWHEESGCQQRGILALQVRVHCGTAQLACRPKQPFNTSSKNTCKRKIVMTGSCHIGLHESSRDGN